MKYNTLIVIYYYYYYYLPRWGEISCQYKDIFTEQNLFKENRIYLKIVFFSPKFLPEHFHCFDEVAWLNAFEIALKSFNQHKFYSKNYFFFKFQVSERYFPGKNPYAYRRVGQKFNHVEIK